MKLVDECGEQDIIQEFWYQRNLHWNPENCIKYVFDPDWPFIKEKIALKKLTKVQWAIILPITYCQTQNNHIHIYIFHETSYQEKNPRKIEGAGAHLSNQSELTN